MQNLFAFAFNSNEGGLIPWGVTKICTLMLIFVAMSGSLTYAQTCTEIFSRAANLSQPRPPKYLFSWTSAESLDELAKKDPSSQWMPLKRIRNSYLSEKWPFFKNKRGIFAWNHPTGAMGTDGEEYSAFGENNEPPRLIVMKIASDAKVIVLKNDGEKLSKEKFEGVDLILHKVKADNVLGDNVFSEWVILNSEKITWFSADPNELPLQVRKKIEESVSPGFQFSNRQLFYPADAGLSQIAQYRRRVVKAYLKTKSSDIPARFRNH